MRFKKELSHLKFYLIPKSSKRFKIKLLKEIMKKKLQKYKICCQRKLQTKRKRIKLFHQLCLLRSCQAWIILQTSQTLTKMKLTNKFKNWRKKKLELLKIFIWPISRMQKIKKYKMWKILNICKFKTTISIIFSLNKVNKYSNSILDLIKK